MSKSKYGEPWRVVERSDTWNIKQGSRCIARFQKKTRAKEEADLVVNTHNAMAGVKDPGELMKALRTFRDYSKKQDPLLLSAQSVVYAKLALMALGDSDD